MDKKNILEKYKQIQEKLLSSFWGFWVKQRRFTFLIMFWVIFFGTLSVINIKKESSPEIDMWLISITTIYQWASPQDVDNLITDKIEDEIKNIDWIKKITSTSKLWISNILLELKLNADETKVLVDVKDAVDKADLPIDAEDPIVTNITTNSDKIFDALLYADAKYYSKTYLYEKALELKNDLKWKLSIDDIDIGWMPSLGHRVQEKSDDLFIYKVLVDRKKASNLWISLLQIVWTIKNWNQNQPLWTHRVWTKKYEFRIQWEYKSVQDLLNTPLSTRNWNILLKDIAIVQKEPKDLSNYFLVRKNLTWQNFVTLTFKKKSRSGIFEANRDAQKLLKEEFQKIWFKWLHYVIENNLADYISDDYQNLFRSWITTLILVFVALLMFVWFKEASIATVAIPLAFYVSFIVLYYSWLSLNFLTNFSLIVSFWIAIDTTLVIIEWAHEKMKIWYNPLNAILLSVRDYKLSVIAWTATTVVVFIPLMSLPWTVWKFLSYIPITIFSTLLASLFFALTVNSALFYKLFKKSKYYDSKLLNLDYIPPNDKILLEVDREWKIEKSEKKYNKNNFTDKFFYYQDLFLKKLEKWYLFLFKKLFKNQKTRILSIIIPIIFLIVSIVVLSEEIWFKMFPDEDKDIMTFEIKLPKWTDTEITTALVNNKLQNILSKIPEIDTAYYQIYDEKIEWILALLPLDYRKKHNMKNVFQLQVDFEKYFSDFEKQWYFVAISYPKNWPPWSQPVAIKLHTRDNSKFPLLIKVASDFKDYLKSLNWSKNVEISSKLNPGLFEYYFNRNKLLYMWLTPADFQRELYSALNWVKAWSLKSEWQDVDIEVSYKDFDKEVNPDDLYDLQIPTRIWPIKFGAVSNYNFDISLDQITREDWQITLVVGWDLMPWYTSDVLQKKLNEFASKYKFPNWVYYSAWWEKADNQDLISSLLSTFIFSIIIIFAILVLQFNSYIQPIIILFSVVMWMFWTNLWLFITWNSYWMMMWIGFIALTWIVVNDAIILIDKINTNIKNWMPLEKSVINAWKTRLQPVILTTLTTVLWLVSLYSNILFQPLAVTIMFGLTVASTMTLFIIPIINYEVLRLQQTKNSKKSTD